VIKSIKKCIVGRNKNTQLYAVMVSYFHFSQKQTSGVLILASAVALQVARLDTGTHSLYLFIDHSGIIRER